MKPWRTAAPCRLAATLQGLFLLAASADAQPTFADIAPILWERCSQCHRPGQAGPFSLLTYNDAAKRAPLLAQVIRSGYMPPWPPRSELGEFEDDRSLTSAERETLLTWLDDPIEGEPASTPPAAAARWQLGPPDLVIEMERPYKVPADGPDIFRNFVIPIRNRTTRYIRGFEFRPGNPRLVHHARMLLDRTGRSRNQDAQDPAPGFGGGMAFDAVFDPPGHWIGWTPGKQPALRPPEHSWTLETNADLVLELHMVPTGKPEIIQSSLGLYFTDQPPRRAPQILRLGKNTIDIPAGEENYVTEDSFTLPVGVEVLSVYAHAHYLGRSVEAWAELPDERRRRLLEIPQWNFDWQDEYRYATPVALPAGTTLHMRFRYDNSAANPRNPNHPPERVTHGWKTSEEMGDLWLQVLPENADDARTLAQAYAVKERQAQIAGLELQIRINPNDPEKQVALGAEYLAANRPEAAIEAFETALELDPDYAFAHYNLARAVEDKERAQRHYRRALELDPRHTPTYNNLALTLDDKSEAIELLERAIEIEDYPEAFANLGALLVATGRVSEAIQIYRAALEIDPDQAVVHYNLANLFRARGDVGAARRHYQAAANGQYQRAAELARRALLEIDTR